MTQPLALRMASLAALNIRTTDNCTSFLFPPSWVINPRHTIRGNHGGTLKTRELVDINAKITNIMCCYSSKHTVFGDLPGLALLNRQNKRGGTQRPRAMY